VEPEDLHKFGLIPEFIGRLPVVTSVAPLDQAALIEILTGPKNAFVKQYQRMFQLDGAELEFEDDALRAIADLAVARKTGARGLRAILEDVLGPIMFEIPSIDDVAKVIVTRASVTEARRRPSCWSASARAPDAVSAPTRHATALQGRSRAPRHRRDRDGHPHPRRCRSRHLHARLRPARRRSIAHARVDIGGTRARARVNQPGRVWMRRRSPPPSSSGRSGEPTSTRIRGAGRRPIRRARIDVRLRVSVQPQPSRELFQPVSPQEAPRSASGSTCAGSLVLSADRMPRLDSVLDADPPRVAPLAVSDAPPIPSATP
jgi:hypothetical protein